MLNKSFEYLDISRIKDLILRRRSKSGYFRFRSDKYPTPLMVPGTYDFSINDKFSIQENSKYQRVIYITSPTQRSGTNFLSLLLKLHEELEMPDSKFAPDEHFLYSFTGKLNEFISTLISYWGYWIKDNNLKQEIHNQMLSYLGDGMLKYLSNYINPGKTLLLKTPDANDLEYFPYLFPNGKAIILLRDGRDTVESFVKSFSGKWAFKKMCCRWSKRVHYIYELMDRENSNNYFKIVKYEELVVRPGAVLKDILEFLYLDEEKYLWNEVSNTPVIGSSSIADNGEDFWEPKKRNSDFNPVGKWERWDKRRKQTFKKYEKNSSW